MAEASPPGNLALWGGWLLPVAGWGLHLMGSYGMIEWYCARAERPLTSAPIEFGLITWTLVCAALAAAGLGLGWRNRRRAKQRSDAGDTYARASFMALVGVFASTLFLIIILAQGAPNLLLEPCQ